MRCSLAATQSHLDVYIFVCDYRIFRRFFGTVRLCDPSGASILREVNEGLYWKIAHEQQGCMLVRLVLLPHACGALMQLLALASLASVPLISECPTPDTGIAPIVQVQREQQQIQQEWAQQQHQQQQQQQIQQPNQQGQPQQQQQQQQQLAQLPFSLSNQQGGEPGLADLMTQPAFARYMQARPLMHTVLCSRSLLDTP